VNRRVHVGNENGDDSILKHVTSSFVAQWRFCDYMPQSRRCKGHLRCFQVPFSSKAFIRWVKGESQQMGKRPQFRNLPVILLQRSIKGRPLHRQLYDALRDLILSGELSTGTRLPSTRVLANTLRISRNTVVSAYEALCARNYLEATVGSGSRVRAAAPRRDLRYSLVPSRAFVSPSRSRPALNLQAILKLLPITGGALPSKGTPSFRDGGRSKAAPVKHLFGSFGAGNPRRALSPFGTLQDCRVPAIHSLASDLH
jgi:hypothetical protein